MSTSIKTKNEEGSVYFDFRRRDLNNPDLKNFLVLFAEHFAKNNIPLIPNAFILKVPEEFKTNVTNTYIDVIGVPFRNVVGRTRFYYNRIYLSKFYDKFKFKLGTRNRPLQVEYPGTDEEFLEKVETKLVKDLKLQPGVLDIKIEDYIAHTNTRTVRIKFKLKDTEFTTVNSGLSLYNDIDGVTVYVKNPNIIAIGVRAALEAFTEYNIPSTKFIFQNNIKGTFSSSILSSRNGLLPEDASLRYISYEQDINRLPEGSIENDLGDILVKYQIPEGVDIENIDIEYFGDGLYHEFDRYNKTIIFHTNTNTNTNVNVKYSSKYYGGKTLLHTINPLVDINYIESEYAYYAATKVKKIILFSQSRIADLNIRRIAIVKIDVESLVDKSEKQRFLSYISNVYSPKIEVNKINIITEAKVYKTKFNSIIKL